jgi:hypothetical protein
MVHTTRRQLLLGAACSICFAPTARAISILQLGGVAAAFAAAAKALGDFAEGIRRAVTEGLKIWDIVTARTSRGELPELSRNLTFYWAGPSERTRAGFLTTSLLGVASTGGRVSANQSGTSWR